MICEDCGGSTRVEPGDDRRLYRVCCDCGRTHPYERLCGCGCGESIGHRSLATKYVDHNHSQRAYRAKVKARMEAAGLPPVASLEVADSHTPTAPNHGDAETSGKPAQRQRRRAPRIGVTVYFPSLGVAAAAMSALGKSQAANHVAAHDAVAKAIKRRQARR